MQYPHFPDRETYGKHFTDVTYWQPYVKEVCLRHHIEPGRQIHSGLPGTHPVFIVDERYVIKFFTYYFGGAESLAVETDLYHLFAGNPPLSIPVPTLITQGNLFSEDNEWPWPYLITNVIPGTGLVEVYEQVHYEDLLSLADSLGLFLRQLHNLNLSQSNVFNPTWDVFAEAIEEQRCTCVERHQHWRTLPTHLIAQIEGYLLPTDRLFDIRTTPHLLHCDLNADHVFGFLDDHKRWHTTGIIDFGDAIVGDWHYDLIALHMGLFRGDMQLLHIFLDSYDPEHFLRTDFVHVAMSYQLMRRFDSLAQFLQKKPEFRDVKSLGELAEILWKA